MRTKKLSCTFCCFLANLNHSACCIRFRHFGFLTYSTVLRSIHVFCLKGDDACLDAPSTRPPSTAAASRRCLLDICTMIPYFQHMPPPQFIPLASPNDPGMARWTNTSIASTIERNLPARVFSCLRSLTGSSHAHLPKWGKPAFVATNKT